MADVVARSTQPALGAIKLAWWRERLEELDEGKIPAEPRLRAVAAELLPRGISGRDVAQLEESWALMLSDDPDQFIRGIASHGAILFGLAARLLGVPMDDHLHSTANSFVSADLARRGIAEMPRQKFARSKTRSPRKARPLTALGALACRDIRAGGPPFEREGSPGRAWTLLKHRLTGVL